MRISYNWLKEYVDIKLAPEKLAELLTMSGLAIESIEKTAGDYIFGIEVTSNRPDWLSYIGVAREVAAITGKKLKMSSVVGRMSYVVKNRKPQTANRKTISVRVEDKKLCPRYTARIVRNVRVGESPAWLKTKIEVMGLRSVNNIVDITNFCLFETGEPMHAFDLDKLAGKEVVVRNAKKGEKIVAIDGSEKILDDSVLVIADSAKAIAIAGVIGGLNTEVTLSTKDILLEAAYFDPVSIRRTSRKLSISTESSYRFERRVDIDNIARSSDRAAQLIAEVAGGEIGEMYDVGQKASPKTSVTLRYSRLDRILGVGVPTSETKRILTSLGLKISPSSKDAVKFEIPYFRYDLKGEIDLIEEVARVYGYDKIPTTIPVIVEQPTRIPRNMVIENRIRDILTGLGADEIITYSLLSRKALAISFLSEGAVDIKNPLSGEQEVMRPSLIPGMLNAAMWNINRKTKDLKLFELGNIYVKESDGKFSEEKHLSIGITGHMHSGWLAASRPFSFFDLKGLIEELLMELGIKQFYIKDTKDDRFRSSACAAIEIEDRPIGILGEAQEKILDDFDIKDRLYMAEIRVDSLLKHATLEKRFRELPKYPSVFRDISIVVGREIPNDTILSSIRDAAGAILKEAKLVDRYKGGQIPAGKLSLTYRLEYQDTKKTLEDREILEIHAKILGALEGKLGARLR